ncbi:MAG TPA: glycosyltransferase family 2 protein, partial [Candidatus Ozemobacteraceae bacterium]|nr:glycosyltransferase family 2 protein [Candidatus Ozemobacteraceae bacterium]
MANGTASGRSHREMSDDTRQTAVRLERTKAARPVHLAIVAPCFNEEQILADSANELMAVVERLKKSGKITPESGIYFVDDGSTDQTWSIIERLHRESPAIRGIRLSRNFGHQGALLAGMMTLREKVDAVVTIDVDLQDEIGVLEQFVDLYRSGHDIVYGVRRKRDTDSLFKRQTALTFYTLLEWMGVEVVYNAGDYRLIGSRPLAQLSEYSEVNLFLRGIFPTMGFKAAQVE